MTIPSTPGMAWATMASLGGQLTGNPAVVPSSDGRLEVFIRGRTDNALPTSHQQDMGRLVRLGEPGQQHLIRRSLRSADGRAAHRGCPAVRPACAGVRGVQLTPAFPN